MISDPIVEEDEECPKSFVQTQKDMNMEEFDAFETKY